MTGATDPMMRTDRTSEEYSCLTFTADVVLAKILGHHNDQFVDDVYDCATGDYLGAPQPILAMRPYALSIWGPVTDPVILERLRDCIDRAHDALGLPLFVPGP